MILAQIHDKVKSLSQYLLGNNVVSEKNINFIVDSVFPVNRLGKILILNFGCVARLFYSWYQIIFILYRHVWYCTYRFLFAMHVVQLYQITLRICRGTNLLESSCDDSQYVGE